MKGIKVLVTGGVMTGVLMAALSGGLAVTVSGCDSSSGDHTQVNPDKNPQRQSEMEKMKSFYEEKTAKKKKS